MLHKTKGIVLRAIKYGDSSLVTTIFTEVRGVQTYMVKGVRSTRAASNRAGLLQPGTLLELVIYQQPQKTMQYIREFQAAYIYTTLHEHVVKNSIVLFSVELLQKLLPEHAPLPELFELAYEYFVALDKLSLAEVANFPLHFIILCSRMLGYEIRGAYSTDTPHLNLKDGGYTAHAPAMAPYIADDDARVLSRVLNAATHDAVKLIDMNADMRLRLIDWYISFLQLHTDHMGNIRSLAILRTILH